jgi:uncharacterized protein (UPF0264 family)
MTALLVSVRNGREARSALAGGAGVIDVKEPARGALGAANPAVWREVAALVAARIPVSAALGELYDLERPDDALTQLATQAGPLALAKVGLAGAAQHHAWIDKWRELRAALPAATALVAVAYADWQCCAAPDPWSVYDQCIGDGCRHLLIDTCDKSRGWLLDHLPLAVLSALVARARADGVTVVLAGSITRANLAKVLTAAPHYVGVRGAVCRGGRTGTIEAALVRELAAAAGGTTEAASGVQMLDERAAGFDTTRVVGGKG